MKFQLFLCISLGLADHVVSNEPTLSNRREAFSAVNVKRAPGGYRNVAYFVNWFEKQQDQRNAGGLIICQGDLRAQLPAAEFDSGSTDSCSLRIRECSTGYRRGVSISMHVARKS